MYRLLLIFMATAASSIAATNLIQNYSFENFSTTNTTFTGMGNGGAAAATNWNVWNNTSATTNTYICPTDASCPAGAPPVQDGTHMLFVTTTGQFDGVWQAWGPVDTGNANASTTALIYVVSGSVQVGTGNDGSTVGEVVLVPTGTWQTVTWLNTQLFNKPANEVIFYSNSLEGAQFYLDGISVYDGVPEPATFLLAGAALVAIGLAARKRSPRK